MSETKNTDVMAQIMVKLTEVSPDIYTLCDLVYHYNKSIGLTYVEIRKEIADLGNLERIQALKNFLQVIEELRSPHLFIDLNDI